MIRFDSDFECGNGKNFAAAGPGRYRMEVVGDKPTYCYYYCFDVTNNGASTELAIEVWHDPVVNDPVGFISHFPSTVWISPGNSGRYHPLDQNRTETYADHIVFHLPIGAGETIRVTDNWPALYSDTTSFLQGLATSRADRCELFSIGKSVQGRDIWGIRAGNPSAPKVLCVAGQHPIEFPGTWGMRATADWITSLIPKAVAMREKLCVEVIPSVNPDGVVAGRNGYNAEDLDMYVAFGDAPDADEPQAVESKLLWRWIQAEKPALWMNIHCYLGWRSNSEPPYDGWYEVPYSIFADPAQARLYEALCDTMRLETDGPSTHIVAAGHGPNTLCYQMAKRFGIPSAFYEINGGSAGAFLSGKRGLHVFKQVAKTLLEHR
jgi:hypothetical protein